MSGAQFNFVQSGFAHSLLPMIEMNRSIDLTGRGHHDLSGCRLGCFFKVFRKVGRGHNDLP